MLQWPTLKKFKEVNILRKNLIRKRKERNLTQAQIASKLGVDRTSYAHYESGRCTPPLDKALKLKKILQADDSIFIDEDETEERKIG